MIFGYYLYKKNIGHDYITMNYTDKLTAFRGHDTVVAPIASTEYVFGR